MSDMKKTETNTEKPAKAAMVIALPKEKKVIALIDHDNRVKGYINIKKNKNLGVHWVATFQDGIGAMSKMGLTGEQWNVWAQLMRKLDYDNYLRVTRRELAQELNMQPVNVSRAIKRLKELDIIMEGPMAGKNKTYRLNPYIAHKGAKNFRKTCLDWQDYKKRLNENPPPSDY